VPTAKHDPIAVDTFERNAPTDQDREEDSKRRDQVCVRDCKRSYPCNGGNAADYRQCPHWDNAIPYASKALRACPHASDNLVIVAKGALDKLFFLFHKTSSSFKLTSAAGLFKPVRLPLLLRLRFGGFGTSKNWMLMILHGCLISGDRNVQNLFLGVCWRLIFWEG